MSAFLWRRKKDLNLLLFGDMAPRHKKLPELAQAISRVKQEGLIVRRPPERFIKKTIRVFDESLVKFEQCAESQDMKLQDAFSEALDDWVAKQLGKPSLKKP